MLLVESTGDVPHMLHRKQQALQRLRQERRAVFVVNGRSRRGALLAGRAEALLRAHGLELTRTLAVTQPGTLDTIVDQALADRPPLLVLGGGDGTVASVVGHLAGTDTVLGYLPLGTTNNLARVLGIPRRLDRAVELLARGHVVDIDLGVANGRHFANMASMGVSVAVSDRTPHTLKRRLGRVAYGLTGAAALVGHRPFAVTVTVDGVEYRAVTHQLNIANGAAHAGSRIAVDAGIDDGLLVAYTLGGPSRWSTATGTVAQALTPHRTLVHKGHLVGQHIQVRTDSPRPVELDGETVAATPLDITVARNALLIVTGPEFDDT
jgi:YegS/Rv2252/BmrU family lipid kinase